VVIGKKGKRCLVLRVMDGKDNKQAGGQREGIEAMGAKQKRSLASLIPGEKKRLFSQRLAKRTIVNDRIAQGKSISRKCFIFCSIPEEIKIRG